jgi:hypothetical protein
VTNSSRPNNTKALISLHDKRKHLVPAFAASGSMRTLDAAEGRLAPMWPRLRG